ncbi:MAG: DUF423 domain-containing protein [Bdellovibrionales bacterium]|nr:DUF423 domain-containing protein [Bdellovibrionales bacterium]
MENLRPAVKTADIACRSTAVSLCSLPKQGLVYFMESLHRWYAAGSGALALAVALGAFGAHGLRERLEAYGASIYEKAVFYHFVHGLGMLLVCLIASAQVVSVPGAKRILLLLLAGLVLFSGSLYLLALTRIRWLGAITPFGGTAFIAAWLLLMYELLRYSTPQQ